MATLYSDAFKSDNTPKSRKYEVGTWTVSATYTLSAALALNDVIKMIPVPAGAMVRDVILAADDLDTGTALVLDVGDTDDTDDTDRYIDGSTVGQAGGIQYMNNEAGFNYQFTEDGTIDVLVETGPGTGATSGTVKLTVVLANDDY